MNNDKKIGILAGMGPRSTSPFIELVLDECQKQYNAKYDIDYPHMMIYSLPTPFYIDRDVDDQELSKAIKKGLEYLASTGVDIIAIPCNSAHKYFEKITKNISVPVLNIIDETMKDISDNLVITVLATDLTMKSNLYQSGIENNNCKYRFNDKWQVQVNALISEIKSTGKTEKSVLLWNQLKEEIIEEGIDTVILACTDLTVVIKNDDERLSIVDSSQGLAKSLINAYTRIK